MRLLRKIVAIIKRIINRLLGLIELTLFLRLLLKFLNANPKAIVVGLIYKYTNILVEPFEFIFENIYWQDKIVETATISAMLGYAILVFAFLKILHLFTRD